MSEQGTLKAFAPEFVFANPYQHHSARRFRGEEFDALVEDIRVNGVHQPPPARPHPEVSGAVQLQMGHRRFAAWRDAHPGKPFTVIVKPLTDLEMLEGVIEENIHRTDLNDIERAQMIETYKQVRPDATNADMARVFRLKDPASITNIRKLLQLPEAIQKHVAEDTLPDAIARQLVGVSKVNKKAAEKIADDVAAAAKSEKQTVFEKNVRDLYYSKLVGVGNWALDWLADAPVTVERDLGDGEHLIGACAGCVYLIGGDRCARKACRDEKQKLFAALEVARCAQEKQIPAVAPEEKTVALFSGNYGDDDRARDLLNARKEIRALLRVAPANENHHSYNYMARVLGSDDVTLVTTDKKAIDTYFDERNAASKSKTNVALSADKSEESEAERAKRIAQEKKEMDAKRAARSAMWKSYYDAKWLLESASRHIGNELAETVRGTFVRFIEEEFCSGHSAYGAGAEIEETLESEIKTAAQDSRVEISYGETSLRLARVALCVIAEATRNNTYSIANNQHEYMFEKVRDTFLAYCTSTVPSKRHFRDTSFGVELPDGWDVPPIHHTPFNCWQCGVFAGNMQEKLTGRDVNEDGWIDLDKDGVFCSEEHRALYHATPDKERTFLKRSAAQIKARAKTKAAKGKK